MGYWKSPWIAGKELLASVSPAHTPTHSRFNDFV
jgi:hypothetical protein